MVRYLKRLKSSRLGRVQAFPMYGGLGMSAPSLHRESTDSLIKKKKKKKKGSWRKRSLADFRVCFWQRILASL